MLEPLGLEVSALNAEAASESTLMGDITSMPGSPSGRVGFSGSSPESATARPHSVRRLLSFA